MKGCFYRSAIAENWPFRAGKWRYAVSRRSGRYPVGVAAEITSGVAGKGIRTAGKHADPSYRCAAGGRNQPAPGSDDCGEAISRRSVLPPERFFHSGTPLRDRVGDIPLLVRHFVDTYAQRINKPIETIPEEAMAELCHYSWPGNVRELQNFIERAVILTSGEVLRVQISDLQRYAPIACPTPEALKDVEREHILQILRETNGVVGGRRGAATRLGIPRTTLWSKMNKLGIISDGRQIPAEKQEDSQVTPMQAKS